MDAQDKIIIHEIKQGNRNVFKGIYDNYYSLLVSFASGYLHTKDISEDVVQNFFTHLWKNRSTIEVKSSLKTYFYVSIKNRCLNRLRDMNIRDERNLIYLTTVLEMNLDINEDEDLIAMIHEALNSLPDQMKKVFQKKYFNGLSIKQIASEMSVTENTVNTQLKRGKKKLWGLLNDVYKSINLFFYC